jgi:hypothetical protein
MGKVQKNPKAPAGQNVSMATFAIATRARARARARKNGSKETNFYSYPC